MADMQPLRTEVIDPVRFRATMLARGAVFRADKSNNLRHVYFSRRLNVWYGVSAEGGAVRVNHYPQCPCILSK